MTTILSRLGFRRLGFRKLGFSKLGLVGVAGAALLAAAAYSSPAAADDYSDFKAIDGAGPAGVTTDGFEPAPGWRRPDYETDPVQRDEITVFEEPPLSNEPSSLDRPLNQFAGETQRFQTIFGP